MTAIGWVALGMLPGALAGGLLVGAFIMRAENVDHDPQQLLALRAACLKDDTSMFTNYCDRYAERYSRIKK